MAAMAGRTGDAMGARRVAQSPGVKLLRADLMPAMVAILSAHLIERRTVPHPEFVALVAEDLDELRDAGFTLPRTAHEYVADWIRDGILVRRGTAAREESVELSRSASDAIRFVAALEQPRSAVTSSRLSNVVDLLRSLARDSDPVPTRRIDALRAQRDQLDDEIARMEAGDYTPLGGAPAMERLREIIRLADEVPGDFAKVADDLEQLNQGLRQQIINHDGSRGGVLESVFDGVDLIENSEAGRTFRAFHSLLLDPRLTEAFDDAIDAVLTRDFADTLTAHEMGFLRQYLSALQAESAQVRSTLTDFSRSLRRFVETQEYRRHKLLADALGRAEQSAMAAMQQHPPQRAIGLELDLTSMSISSIGGWSLHNPADLRSAVDVVAHDSAELDLERLRELVRLTEIDFAELQRNVADALADQPTVTVGDVLARTPATQGLASVLGLLWLAVGYGTPAEGREAWEWSSVSGAPRVVSGPRYVFSDVPEQWRQG